MSASRLRLRYLTAIGLESAFAAAALAGCQGAAPAQSATGRPVEIAIATPPDEDDSSKPKDDGEQALPARTDHPKWQPANNGRQRGCTPEREVPLNYANSKFLACPAQLYPDSRKDVPLGARRPRPPNLGQPSRAPFSEALTNEARSNGFFDACCYEQRRRYPVMKGRPLIVDGVAQLSETAGADDATELARYWIRAAREEHASIAAFARLNLQLIALGAPTSLLSAVSEAARDETRHASDCFAQAARWLDGQPLPSPLPASLAPINADLDALVRENLVDGFLNETIAARVARAAAQRCGDAQTRRILEGIARDEERHAEVAWRIIAWAVSIQPSTVDVLHLAANGLLGAHRNTRCDDYWLSDVEMRSLVAETITEIVLPCVAALKSHVSSALLNDSKVSNT